MTAPTFGGQTIPIPSHLVYFHSGPGDLAPALDFVGDALTQGREAAILFGPRGVPARTRRALEAHMGRDLESEVSTRLALIEGEDEGGASLARLV